MCTEDKNELQTVEAISPLQNAAALVANNSEMDVDKLGKLLELQERWDATQAKKAYTVAMAEFQSQSPKIIKQKDGHNCKYAGLSDIVSVIAPILAGCGLSYSWVTERLGKEVKVTCKLTHKLGHSEETWLSAESDTSGSKNAIQALGSTITYLQRYTLKAALGLAEADQGDDGNSSETDDTPEVPKFTDANVAAMEAICEHLRKDGHSPDVDKVAAIFFAQKGVYPKDISLASKAAAWLISQKRNESWTIKPRPAGIFAAYALHYNNKVKPTQFLCEETFDALIEGCKLPDGKVERLAEVIKLVPLSKILKEKK